MLEAPNGAFFLSGNDPFARQVDMEDGSALPIAFSADKTLVILNDLFAKCQADASTGELFTGMQPAEQFEKTL